MIYNEFNLGSGTVTIEGNMFSFKSDTSGEIVETANPVHVDNLVVKISAECVSVFVSKHSKSDIELTEVQKEVVERQKITWAPKNNVKEGKHRMSELPLDLLAEMLCPAYKEGSDGKYYRYSWRKGFLLSIMMDACLRHLDKFFNHNEIYDQQTLEEYGIKKHHLGAAVFCIISMYNDWKNQPENDDRPFTDYYNPNNMRGSV